MNNVKSYFNKNKYEGSILVLIAIIIEIFFYLSESGFSVMSYVGAVIILFSGLMLTLEKSTYLFFILVANQRLLVILDNDISLINILIITIIFKQIQTNVIKFSISTILIIVGFVAYSIIPSFVGSNYSNIILFVRVLALFIMLFNIRKYKNDKKEIYSRVLLYFSLGCIVMGVLGILFDPNFVLGTSYRFMGSALNNPNDFSMMLIFSVSVLSVYYNINHNHRLEIFFIVLGLVFFGLLTQSRTFIFGLIIIIFWYLLFTNKQLKFRKKNIGTSFIILLLIVVLVSISDFRIVFEVALDRIINPRQGDITGSRFELWGQYYDFLVNNPKYLFFGIGMNLDILKQVGINYVAHNFLIEHIVNWGIVGLVISFILFRHYLTLFLGKQISRFKLSLALSYVPLLTLVVLSLTRHAPLNISFVTNFFIGVMVIKLYYERDKNKLPQQ